MIDNYKYIFVCIAFFCTIYYFTMAECNRGSTFLVGRYSRHSVSCDYKYQYLFGYALILLIAIYYLSNGYYI